jgi:hypothetical protein
MPSTGFRDSPLTIASFEDLIKHEVEIVHRINQTPNGGHLLLIDASRLLADLGVTLTESAVAEWRRRSGFSVATPSPSRIRYDAVAQASPHEHIRIRVQHLLTKETR